MQISAPCVVTLTWRLEDAQGAEIDELAEPLEFFYGGDDLLAKVEEALAGQETGYSTTLHLEPEHAFGDYDPRPRVLRGARPLPGGDSSRACSSTARRPARRRRACRADAIYTVTEVYPEHVVLDGNHPLAGIALRLALVVRDVREATDEEIEAGSVGSSAVSVLARAAAGQPPALSRGAGPGAALRSRRACGRRGGAALRASSPAPCR